MDCNDLGFFFRFFSDSFNNDKMCKKKKKLNPKETEEFLLDLLTKEKDISQLYLTNLDLNFLKNSEGIHFVLKKEKKSNR